MRSLNCGLKEYGIGDDWLQSFLEIALQHMGEHRAEEFGFDSDEWHRAKTALDKFLNPAHPTAHPEGTLRHYLIHLMENPSVNYVFVINRAGVSEPLVTFLWDVYKLVHNSLQESTARGKLLNGNVVWFGQKGGRHLGLDLNTKVTKMSSGVSWEDDAGGGTIRVYKAETVD